MNEALISPSDLYVKIQVDDLTDKVYERLKKAITMNVIKPGERIDMNLLSDHWGVSRTPMKDAIARLTSEGLVEVRSKVGTYATQFTEGDMLELFAIRLLIEEGICHEVVYQATPTKLMQLEATQQLLENELAKRKDKFDYFTFNHLDAAFHEQLIGLANNRKLLDVYRSLNFHNQVARYFYNSYEQRSIQTIREHRQMIECIRLKSGEQLREMIRTHILSGKERVVHVIPQEVG
jgi:DNA-binding GntR family transcriptional regulator